LQTLLNYYNASTVRDIKGQVQSLGADARIGNGQTAVYSGEYPVVAVYSSRGPDIRDFSFNNADMLKPNVLAPGTLIWGAWSPVGIDQVNFLGELVLPYGRCVDANDLQWQGELLDYLKRALSLILLPDV
jgi:hypothetical protein